MTWVRVDDGFFEHPKTLAVGDAAAYLFLAGLGYCNRRLTNGLIPKAMVQRLTTVRRWETLAQRLVEAGYWYDRGEHYESHEYLLWNESRADVEAKRQQKQVAGRAGGQASAEQRRSREAATPQADTTADAMGSGSESGEAKSNPSPLRSSPLPSSLRSDDVGRPTARANGPDPEAQIAAWTADWAPIRQQLTALPFLARYRHWLADLSWWQTMDAFVTSAPKELDALLVDAVAQVESEGYVPRTKRALRQKLRNLLHVAATIAEREARREAQTPRR